MGVGTNADTDYLRRSSIPSGGAGTLSDGAFKNCFVGVWLYRDSAVATYGLTAEGSIIHFQAGAREVTLRYDNNFGSGTASDPNLNIIFNSGGGTGSEQDFTSANFLDEWVYYFVLDNSTDGQIAGYIKLSDLNTATTITRANDNAGSQYINTLTIGNGSGGTSAVAGWYAYARAVYGTGITVADALAYAASDAADAGDWGWWELPSSSDVTDTSGNGRNFTIGGTLSDEDSPVLGGGGGATSLIVPRRFVRSGIFLR